MSGLELSGISPYGMSPDPSCQVILGGALLPGIVKVTGVKRGQKIDKKPQKGKGGIKVTFEGAEALEAMIEIEVWTEDQLKLLGDFIQLLDPPDGKGNRQPYDVYHEFFFSRAVTQIIIESIEGPSFGKKPGFYEAKFKVMEWKAEYATGGSVSPKAAVQGSNGPQTTLDIERYTDGTFDRNTGARGAGPGLPTANEPPLPTDEGVLPP